MRMESRMDSFSFAGNIWWRFGTEPRPKLGMCKIPGPRSTKCVGELESYQAWWMRLLPRYPSFYANTHLKCEMIEDAELLVKKQLHLLRTSCIQPELLDVGFRLCPSYRHQRLTPRGPLAHSSWDRLHCETLIHQDEICLQKQSLLLILLSASAQSWEYQHSQIPRRVDILTTVSRRVGCGGAKEHGFMTGLLSAWSSSLLTTSTRSSGAPGWSRVKESDP
ncbi:uncharacterized protein J3D65DRAFT_119769 [Phyllosticta citribraziliensis]|uniref:Uncharacterized protein n=1 Tax=Phyllosticta citribraziliensis TaxID=989973 RepID=A0ABR1LD57_9PEZI